MKPPNPDDVNDAENLANMAKFGEMTREVLHEISSPLTTMQFQVQKIKKAIAKEPIDTPTIATSTDSLSSSLIRINKIREAVKERFSAHVKKQFNRTNILLSVKEALTASYDSLTARHVTVHLTIPPELYVACKAIELIEVWINLIENSSAAISGKPERWIRIEAKTSPDEKLALVTFTDCGTDVDEATKKRFFTESFSTKPNGSGLGLGITKRIIESCGGTIEVSLKSPHTQLLILLPRV